jgi:hypothetical protein
MPEDGICVKEIGNQGKIRRERVFVQHFQHLLRTKFVGYNRVHNPVHVTVSVLLKLLFQIGDKYNLW